MSSDQKFHQAQSKRRDARQDQKARGNRALPPPRASRHAHHSALIGNGPGSSDSQGLNLGRPTPAGRAAWRPVPPPCAGHGGSVEVSSGLHSCPCAPSTLVYMIEPAGESFPGGKLRTNWTCRVWCVPGYRIAIRPRAARSLRRLDAAAVKAVAQVIDSLEADPRPVGATPLVGHRPYLRVRSGDYRIVLCRRRRGPYCDHRGYRPLARDLSES
jgi:mRNA-degrading endonuclease RelE of RelBE toxin-antitoxin system